MDVRILPPEEVLETQVQLPLSKSESNRALIMAALTPAGQAPEVADCGDTRAMLNALTADSGQQTANSGQRTADSEQRTANSEQRTADSGQQTANSGQQTADSGQRTADSGQQTADSKQRTADRGYRDVNVGLAGTAMRFLTAYFAATEGAKVRLDGNQRMRQRPIGVLVDALRACGADIAYADQEGFPPLLITGKKLHGGALAIDASVSSQFLSALLMVAPTMDKPLTLTLEGRISSLPYLDMTLGMMRQRGIQAVRENRTVTVAPGTYKNSDVPIEPDWSAASYWYEIAAMTAGWVTLPGLQNKSMQGDSRIVQIFEKLGVVTEFDDAAAQLSASPEMNARVDEDLSDTPDIAQTIAVTCCMLGVPFRLSGLASLKIKETDRLEALRQELLKLSFVVEIEHDDTLVWEMERIPVTEVGPVHTYGDHRMAMAFAPVAIFLPGLTIKDAEVVDKSYPKFWDDLRQAGFIVEEVNADHPDTDQPSPEIPNPENQPLANLDPLAV